MHTEHAQESGSSAASPFHASSHSKLEPSWGFCKLIAVKGRWGNGWWVGDFRIPFWTLIRLGCAHHIQKSLPSSRSWPSLYSEQNQRSALTPHERDSYPTTLLLERPLSFTSSLSPALDRYGDSAASLQSTNHGPHRRPSKHVGRAHPNPRQDVRGTHDHPRNDKTSRYQYSIHSHALF